MINSINDKDEDFKTILKDATTYQKRIIYNFFVSFLKARKNNFSLESMHELRDAIYRLYRNLYKDTRILNTKTKIKDFISNINQFSKYILTHSLPRSLTQEIVSIQDNRFEELFSATINAIQNIKKPDLQTLSLLGIYNKNERGEFFKNILNAYDELMQHPNDNNKMNNLISAIIQYVSDYNSNIDNVITFQTFTDDTFIGTGELNIAFINYYGYKMPPLVETILDTARNSSDIYIDKYSIELIDDIKNGKIKTYDEYKEEQDVLARKHLDQLFNINTQEDLLNFNYSTYCCGCRSYNNDSLYDKGINNDETEINNRYTNWNTQKPYWCCF